MALFGNKKEEKKETATKEVAAAKETPSKKDTAVIADASFVNGREDLARVLTHPRITEKATRGIEKSVYVFDVASSTNKKQIKEAVKAIYGVTPTKVHVTAIAKKYVRNLRTGIKGTKSGGKKAYVYLKKGDTISIM